MDTTGAGDVFAGVLAAGWLAGHEEAHRRYAKLPFWCRNRGPRTRASMVQVHPGGVRHSPPAPRTRNSRGWRQQPGTPVYTTDLDANGVRRALAGAKRERGPQWRATERSPGDFTAPA